MEVIVDEWSQEHDGDTKSGRLHRRGAAGTIPGVDTHASTEEIMSEAGLVQAILANPWDETARLVYADWLEEQGDPLSGGVRLAVRLRASYGPRRSDHSPTFWHTIAQGIEPIWWVEEVHRLAAEVDDRVGDGSKSAVLIALALVETTRLFPGSEGWFDAEALRNTGKKVAATVVRDSIRATSVKDVRRCLQAAALGDSKLSGVLLSAFELSGRDGMITVDRVAHLSAKATMYAQVGMRFPLTCMSGCSSEVFNAAVLVAHRRLDVEEIRQVLRIATEVAGGLICLCRDLEEAGRDLVRTAVADGIPVIVCAEPDERWQDCFDDIAAATNASIFVVDQTAPVEISAEQLGRVRSARVEAGHLVLDEPESTAEVIYPWIDHLRRLIDETEGEAQQWHCLRLAQLMGGVITVEVCGATPEETDRLYALACGAMHAGRAMIADGYVPGAGVGYLRAANAVATGAVERPLRWALEEPIRALLAGSRRDKESVLAALRADERLGLDVVRKPIPQWRIHGPIDPARVVRTVIECAIEAGCRMREASKRRGP